MGGGGGGGSGLLNMGLMVAAGIAAPELAAEIAPEIMAAGGVEGAAVGAATGAGLSGLTAAAIGQDPTRAALVGGLGGAVSGAMPDTIGAGTQGTASTPPPTNINSSLVNPPGTLPPAQDFGLTPPPVNPTPGTSSIGLNANTVPSGITPPSGSAIPPPGSAAPTNFLGMNGPTNAQLYTSAGINALGYQAPRPGAYTPPNAIDTGGSLSKFHYDPNNYSPDVVVPPRPPYQANYSGMAGAAEGGLMSLASGGYASGGKTYNLGSYSDGGRLLKGPGDGMSDDIPATIGGKQEARLADGEFVVPADVVSGLGNGSTDAGAKHLYKMMDKVRHARTGRKSQAKQIKGEKFVPA